MIEGFDFDHERETGEDLDWTGRIGTWRDENETGADLELGFELDDWYLRQSQTKLTLFGSNGKFSDAVGVRAAYSLWTETGSWDLYSEFSRRQQDNFSGDLQDLPLFKLRLSRGFQTSSGWNVDLYLEGTSWQEESAVSLGFFTQKSF